MTRSSPCSSCPPTRSSRSPARPWPSRAAHRSPADRVAPDGVGCVSRSRGGAGLDTPARCARGLLDRGCSSTRTIAQEFLWKYSGGMSESPSRSSVTVSDPRSMRALAHPLRLKLLGILRTDGPRSVGQLADLVDQAPGTVS
ncbi:MAG: helix-turn-helix domain-containing protein, partial [Leifsonia sp.]